MLSIFKRYPELTDKIQHTQLANFPTPIYKLQTLSEELDLDTLFLKEDGICSEIYGGNKVRKIEFLLGQALKDGRKEVLTFGGAGSNHATVTAVYANRVGLRSISMLSDQLNAHYLRRNLLMSYKHGAELHLYPTDSEAQDAALAQLDIHEQQTGIKPMMIPSGGSSPLGVVGFVNAGLELADQIEAGALPEPDIIYCAMGSMGTAAGLFLGLKASGLKSELVPVRVVPEKPNHLELFINLVHSTNSFLHVNDPEFPIVDFDKSDIRIRHDFYPGEYARFTESGIAAISKLRETEGFVLEGTYSANAFAALLNDASSGKLTDKKVLFWKTNNSCDITQHIDNLDYRDLPIDFHKYFENDVQPLDV